jgi:hypothetical protein
MRFNPRIILFVLVTLAIVGLPTYAFLDERLSGGVKEAGDHLDVNLKAMTSFELDQETGVTADVPAQWRKLDGRRVSLTGQAFFRADVARARSFELVFSIANCCQFGSVQLKQHFVLAKLREEAAVPGSGELVRVTGRLHVRVEHEDGRVSRVFTIDVERVDPAL